MDRSSKLWVQQVGKRWVFGREGTLFEAFPSFDLALRRAQEFAERHPGTELVVLDEKGNEQAPPPDEPATPASVTVDRRMYVRKVEAGRWVLSRQGASEEFGSKEAAVQAAVGYVLRHPETELIVED